MPFVAPDGSDPARYAAKYIEDNIRVKEGKLKRIGEKLLEEIRIRTADSESYNGEAFVPYAPDTAARKGYDEANLYSEHDSVHMMDVMEVRITTEPVLMIEIGFFTHGDKASIAQIQNEGSHLTVATHRRAGRTIAAFQRRRPIRGMVRKGGRMQFDTKKLYEEVEKRKTVTHSKRVMKWIDRLNEDTGNLTKSSVGPKRGAFKAPPSVVEANQRIFVRRRRSSVWEKYTTEHVTKVRKLVGTEKVPTFRRGVKSVIPARPVLGLSDSDLDFIARNVVAKGSETQ